MTAQPTPLRRFYVYVLKGADGEVFYVGRGTGGRMMQHMARSHNEGVNVRLSEAVAGDEKITAQIVSWHSSQDEAALEEKRVIGTYDPKCLTNIQRQDCLDEANLPPLLAKVQQACRIYCEASAKRKEAIVEAVKAGVVMRQIAEAANMDAAYVRKIARDAGIEPRAPGRKREQRG